jgi:2-methylcitrate dehydratase PrpD
VGRPGREPTSRWLLFGCAAADGVLAALAAAGGVAGDADLLGTVLAAHAGTHLHGIGPAAERPAVARVDVKPFCTARQTLPAIEAARAAWAAAGGTDVSAIAAVEVGVPDAYRAMIDQPRPADRLSSIMSAQFQIAAALYAPDRLYDVVRARPELDPTGARLMAVVGIAADPELLPLFPGVWSARVRLRLGDGRVLERSAPAPGESGASQPPWDGLLEKQQRLGLGTWAPALADACRALAGDPAAIAPPLLDLIPSSPTLDQVAPPGGIA